MQLVGPNTYAQYIVKGLVPLAAVGFDTWQNAPKTKRKAT
jgi:ABC-type xylose transport system permease subunit